MEEILRLVKVDQAKTEKRMNGMADEPSHTPEEIKELIKGVDVPGQQWPKSTCSMRAG